MLDIRRLQALQAVARHGSIAAAARALHFTAPAVSQQLAALERETSASLFHRTARSIRLTDDGVLLAAHADIVLSTLESASNALATNRAPAGPLRIAAFPTAISGVLAPALRALAELHPGVGATVTDAEPDAAEELLRVDQIDVAITHHYDLVPRAALDLVETMPLYDEPMLLVRAADPGWTGQCLDVSAAGARAGAGVGSAGTGTGTEPAAWTDVGVRAGGGGAVVDLRSLHAERWILPPLGTTCHEHVQRACGAAGFVPDIAAQCTEYHGALAFVRAGLGVALVPAVALDESERHGLDVARTVDPLRRYVSLRVAVGRITPAVRSLSDILRDVASSLQAELNPASPVASGIST